MERGAFLAGSHCFNAVGVGPGIWPLLCLMRRGLPASFQPAVTLFCLICSYTRGFALDEDVRASCVVDFIYPARTPWYLPALFTDRQAPCYLL